MGKTAFGKKSLLVFVSGLIALLSLRLPTTSVRFLQGQGPSPGSVSIELSAPYWNVGGGIESTLVINNTSVKPIDVVARVFTSNGILLPASALTLAAGSSIDVSLQDLLGINNSSGQIGLAYTGKPLDINAHMIIADRNHSLTFSQPFVAKSEFSSSRLEGVFYLPRPSARAELVVSNMGTAIVSAEVSFSAETHHGSVPGSRTLVLGPHETRALNVAPYTGATSTQAASFGVQVSHTGLPGEVLVQGMVSDVNGFSANMRFLERAALTNSELFSPVLPLNETLETVLVLKNTNTNQVNIEVEAYYTLGTEREESVLHNVSVEPGKVRSVNLGPEMQTLPPGAANVGLKLSYDAPGTYGASSGGLLADILRVDGSGSSVYQVTPKGYSMDLHSSHSFPFRIGGNSETLVTVANPYENEKIVFGLFILFEGQGYTYAGNILEPGEVRHISIKELRDNHVAGVARQQIPETVTSGQVQVTFFERSDFLGGESGHSNYHHGPGTKGFSSAIIYDDVLKMSLILCAGGPPTAPECLLIDIDDDESGYSCSQPPVDMQQEIQISFETSR